MTDNDIVKALECCVDWCGNVSCWDYPLKNTGCIHFDKLKESLDLINRQKAEIERLKEHCSKCGEKTTKTILNLQELLGTAKAEAYKEFADRLKENSIATFSWNGVVLVEEIDNLLKEMESDNNA